MGAFQIFDSGKLRLREESSNSLFPELLCDVSKFICFWISSLIAVHDADLTNVHDFYHVPRLQSLIIIGISLSVNI